MQAKDQLQSAHHGRTVSIAARTLLGISVIAFAAEATAEEPSAQLEATSPIAPFARIERGAIAITSASERGHSDFDRGALRVESSAEGAGEAVATVLQPPRIGHAQLEAAIGI